jgi:general secretion pathway protein J
LNKLIKNRCKGFTLVEVLVSVLIFSIIILTLFSSFKAFIISSEYVKDEVTYNEKIRNIFKRINMDLESLVVLQTPRYEKPEFNSDPDPYRLVGKEETMGQDIVSSIVFPSLAHAVLGVDQRAGVARIAYYLRENENNTYDLYRADSLPPFPEEPGSCSDPILCQDISGFEIVYMDFNGDEHSSWDSDSQEFKYTFPVSIDFKIVLGSGKRQQVFETSIGLISGRAPIE